MPRTLTTTTLVDGVIYEAGTAEADIPGAAGVTADVWDGQAELSAPAAFDPAVGGTMDATKAYVGDDQTRAAALLELEQKADKPRSTLVEWLAGIATPPAT